MMTLIAKRSVLLILLAWFPILYVAVEAEVNGINRVTQDKVWSFDLLGIPELEEGLAGSYFGWHNRHLIIAGGSAFPHGKPWEGGAKYFSDAVIVLEKPADGEWKEVYQGHDLPVAIGEGASVSVPNGLLCIGGQSNEGLSRAVNLIAYDNGQLSVKRFPDLPYRVRGHSATVIGSKVFVVGGETDEGPSDGFMSLIRHNQIWVGKYYLHCQLL
ncbi:hypothetical protein [Geofilum rubicundum]|nr:hypothetical protein [Geofilum rubicundum]